MAYIYQYGIMFFSLNNIASIWNCNYINVERKIGIISKEIKKSVFFTIINTYYTIQYMLYNEVLQGGGSSF